MVMNANKPNREQIAALKTFAAAHGRNWKSELSRYWFSGWGEYGYERAEVAYLQQLRNQFGPQWLRAYSLDEKGGR